LNSGISKFTFQTGTTFIFDISCWTYPTIPFYTHCTPYIPCHTNTWLLSVLEWYRHFNKRRQGQNKRDKKEQIQFSSITNGNTTKHYSVYNMWNIRCTVSVEWNRGIRSTRDIKDERTESSHVFVWHGYRFTSIYDFSIEFWKCSNSVFLCVGFFFFCLFVFYCYFFLLCTCSWSHRWYSSEIDGSIRVCNNREKKFWDLDSILIKCQLWLTTDNILFQFGRVKKIKVWRYQKKKANQKP
jgi:hypothetical protein